MTTKNTVRLLALVALSSACALPASAQWGPEEEKNCVTRPGTSGSLTLSAQGGNGLEDSSKLQEYETIPKGVFVPCATFAWTNDKDYFVDAVGTKLGLDDQFASVFAGKKGGALSLVWDQNPNWKSNTAQTPYSETISGNTASYHVPDGMRLALQNVYTPWVAPTSSNPAGVGSSPANPTVPGFFAVEPWVTGAPGIDLRYVRKTGKAGLDVPVGKNFVLKASYSHETRDGNKNTTFYGGSANYEVATPIDYKTDDFSFSGDYANGRLFANVTADFNKFTNEVLYAEIDNPERLQLNNPNFPARTVYNDVSLFRLWLPPDNKAYQVDFTAGYTLPAHHKITGSLSTGQMKMDESLQNLSTNPALGLQPPNAAFTIVPPYGSIEAKYDTFMLNFRLTGDPFAHFGYIATYRKFELKDKTEEYEFLSTVRGDVGAGQRDPNGTGESGPLIREHFGWSVETLRGEVHFLPTTNIRLSASYGQDKRKFDIGLYEDVSDKSLVINADLNWRFVSFHGAFTNFDRDPGTPNEPPIWQGATFTDVSQRGRKTWNGLVTLTPTEKIALSVNGLTQQNDFPASSVTGLLDQTFDTFGIDLTYAPTARLSLMAGYVYEKYFFDMSAAYIPRGQNPPFDPANQWNNATNDKVDTFRAGVTWNIVPDKVDLDATFDYTKPRSDSQYDFALPGTPIGGLNEANGIFPANVPPIPGFPATAYDSFPLVNKEFIMAKVRLAYHVAKNFTASAMYWKQKYDNTDWQTDLMQPYMGHVDPGANRWFFLGARVPSYDANIFRASLTYTF